MSHASDASPSLPVLPLCPADSPRPQPAKRELERRAKDDAVIQRAQPAWIAAQPKRIAQALAHVQALPGDGWCVVDASEAVVEKPTRVDIAGKQYVHYRGPDGPRIAPASCPHMGADLSTGRVCEGKVICPWHGLALGDKGHGRWRPLQCVDDGVLTWVNFSKSEVDQGPPLPERPDHYVHAVHQFELECDPCDVIANRLDPWHGAHLHPHSFSDIQVLEDRENLIELVATVKILGGVQISSRVNFHCPGPRSIVMTIVEGEGAGSVLETHATPIREGRCRVHEATLATSSRLAFRTFVGLPGMRHLMRYLLNTRARMLWQEDADYCERLYELRASKPA